MSNNGTPRCKNRVFTEGGTSDVGITAFKDLPSGNFVIVVINTGASIQLDFTVEHVGEFNLEKMETWVTSGSQSLGKGPDVAVAGTTFSATVEGSSATAFVGRGPSETVKTADKVSAQKILDNKLTVSGRALSVPPAFYGEPAYFPVTPSLVFSTVFVPSRLVTSSMAR